MRLSACFLVVPVIAIDNDTSLKRAIPGILLLYKYYVYLLRAT